MAKSIKIKGTVQFIDLSTGFWGIVDEKGRKWRPVDLASELQKNGLSVQMTIQPLDVEMSIFMWGDPVEVQDYKIL